MKRKLAEHYSQVPDRIFRDPSLRGAKREVLVNVVGHILPGDHYAMKLEQIAKETGYVRSTVAPAVDELERRRFLEVERRVEHGKQQASVFRIGPAWWDATEDMGPPAESDSRTQRRGATDGGQSPIHEPDRVQKTGETESDNRTAKAVDPRAVDPTAVDPPPNPPRGEANNLASFVGFGCWPAKGFFRRAPRWRPGGWALGCRFVVGDKR